MKRLIFAVIAALFLPAVAHAQYAYEPTYGSTNSTQFRAFSSLSDVSSLQLEGPQRFTEAGDTDVIGGAYTRWEDTVVDGNRYEGHYQKSWRPFEGQRTRAMIYIPVDVITVNGKSETTAAIVGSLEYPINDNWSLTPGAAFGAAWVPAALGLDGSMVMGSVTSRYRFPQVGRGDLVLADEIAYSHTLNGVLTSKQPFYAATASWIYRNGLGYQFPLETMMFGRQSSMRISYTYTYLDGDPVGQNNYNEVAVSLGVRNREAAAKNAFDLLRFGLVFNWGQNIGGAVAKEGTLTVGYRF